MDLVHYHTNNQNIFLDKNVCLVRFAQMCAEIPHKILFYCVPTFFAAEKESFVCTLSYRKQASCYIFLTCDRGLHFFVYNIQMKWRKRIPTTYTERLNSILLYKFVKFGVNKRFWHYNFPFSRSLQVSKMRIEWQFCHPRRSWGGKSVTRFSIFQTRWLRENGNL